MEDLKTVVREAEELLKKATSEPTRDWMKSVQARAKKSLKAANDWLAEEESAVTARARDTAKATDDYVRANTWKVLGISAMAGLVVGMLAVRLGQSFLEQRQRPVTPGEGTPDNGQRMKDQ